MKKERFTVTISVTRCGDLLPFWQFLVAFGANFFPKIAKKKLEKLVVDVDILGFEKCACYCGDKFGDFSPIAGNFFETTGHIGDHVNTGPMQILNG